MSGMGGKRTLPKVLWVSDKTPMATGNLEAEIIDLLVEERGLPRERIQLTSRLLQDLGMDGDDAVDFFDTIHKRFGTDLTSLYDNWVNHFGPEGVSCWNGLVILPAAIIGGLFAGGSGLSTFWGIALTIAVLAAWLWAMRRWGPPDKMVPVTVREVVTAVEAGAWPSRAPS
jgi:hypothetical protein